MIFFRGRCTGGSGQGRFRRSAVIFLLCCIIAPSIRAQSFNDLLKLRQREIVAIRFEGNRSISDEELLSKIETRTSNWLQRTLNWINSGIGAPHQFIDPDVQGADTLRIYALYHGRGFLDVHVSYTLREDSASAAVWQAEYERRRLQAYSKESMPYVSDTVIFQIDEGSAYTVNFFSVSGLELLPPDLLDQLTRETMLKKGSRYSVAEVNSEKARVEDILREHGYAFFTSPRDTVIVNPIKKTVNINMLFRTGPRVRIGAVHVTYDTSEARFRDRGTIRPSVVRRSIMFDSGAWFRFSDLSRSERSLGMLGTFELYRIDLDTSAFAGKLDAIRDGTPLPVSVFLRMRSTSGLTGGVFGGSGFGGFDFGVIGAFDNRSIFGGAENFTIQAQYQFLPLTQIRGNLGAALSFPYGFLESPLILSPSYNYTSLKGAFTERILEFQVGANKLLTEPGARPRIYWSPKLAVEFVDHSISDTSYHLSKTPQFNVPFTPLDVLADWSNDLLNPSSGSVLAGSFEIGLPFAEWLHTNQPSSSYLKIVPQVKTYLDPSGIGASIFAFRAALGIISLTSPGDTLRDIPIERRFFGGGPNSLRAWPSRGLLVSYNTAPNAPTLGGYTSIEGNIEWRYAPFQYPGIFTAMESFLSDVRIALFIDAGNVWDRGVPPSLKTMAIASGLGLHYNTLFGALRFDLGLKLYDPNPTFSSDNVIAVSPTSTGVWLFNRGRFRFWDVAHFEFALGQAF